MKRSGFTMIELVFVIVILGILASVAIPKLAATRDDANIAKATTEVSSLVSDLGSYYTAQGRFDDNISKMTNVTLYKADATPLADANLSSATAEIFYSDKTRKKDCLSFRVDNSNGNLTVATASDAGTPFCKGLITALGDKIITTHSFGGSSIYK